MYKKLSLAVLLVVGIFVGNALSQGPTDASKLITFEKPTGWFESTKSEKNENLKKFEMSEEQLNKILADDKANNVVAIYHQSDPNEVAGIIPTIRIDIRRKSNVTFDLFKKSIEGSIRAIDLPNLKILGESEILDISKIKSVVMNASFDLKMNDETFAIRTRMYAIPKENYFIQITVSDENTTDWAEKEFTAFINSVKIVK